MWGNGKQTRSFCYIDDAVSGSGGGGGGRSSSTPKPSTLTLTLHPNPSQVEGILRLMVSDYKKPLNIGSDEMVSMNQI